LVFAALLATRLREQPSLAIWRILVQGVGDAHRFGDLTLEELAHGEAWRLITCTFVHYSLIHIALNLVAFYLLGTLVESWYGAGQFVLIYGLTGALGNLISALIRFAAGFGRNVHSGGGSVVIMGLIGLCAVMGWKSRTAKGNILGWQMFKAIGLTGLLGIAFPRYIDNWGHAGGAIVGALLGLCHHWFLRQYARPSAWGLGIVTALLMAGCAIAQASADWREAPRRRDAALRLELALREFAFHQLRAAPASLNQETDHHSLATRLGSLAVLLDQGAYRSDYRRLCVLANATAKRALSAEEKAEFTALSESISARLRDEMAVRQRELWSERRGDVRSR
jgi:rhomboid protease GluP